MKTFKNLKYFVLFGFGTLFLFFLGISTFKVSSDLQKHSKNFISNSLLNQAATSSNDSLGPVRRFQNNNFTGIPIKNTMEGSLVLTGQSSITRTDFFGNVLWRFDPTIPSSVVAAKADANGNLISGLNNTPLLSEKNYINDLAGKMVIEAAQDQINPNLFYLLLIPQDYQVNTRTYDQINADKKNQGTIVAISENFNLFNQPYGIVGIQNIKAEDMVKNYPSSWRQISSPTGPNFFTKTNHTNYFDNSDSSGTAISMPWFIYITNLANLYGTNGNVYISGGNGTIFNDEDILSIGIFKASFNFDSEKSSSIGWPYALILSNIKPISNTSVINTFIQNLPMGQDTNYQYVPRMAVAGLVPVINNNRDAITSVSLIGTITLGTKADQGKPSSEKIAPLTDSEIGDNFTNASGSVTAATGNSYTVQTLFETYLSLSSLNNLSKNLTVQETSKILANVISPLNINFGVPYEVWQNSTSVGKTFIEDYLYTLVSVGNFSPRNLGNVVSFNNSEDNNYRSYYFQLGGFLIKMYSPVFEQSQFTSSRLSIYQDAASSENKTFATLTNDTKFKNNWSDFKGTFMIGGDNNYSSLNTIIGSVWTAGIYYNKFMGQQSSAPQVSASQNNYVRSNLTPYKSITQTAYESPSGAYSASGNNGILGYKIDNLSSALNIPYDATFNGVISSTGINETYVQLTGSNNYTVVALNNNQNLALGSVYDKISKINNLGSGNFKTSSEIGQAFFTNSISSILANNNTILAPEYKEIIFNYSSGKNIANEDWRISVLNYDTNNNSLILSAEVKNPLTGKYTPTPNLNNQNSLLNTISISGFNSWPSYLTAMVVILPIVIIALTTALALGIGIPVHRNKKILKKSFIISSKKINTLTTATGRVFKKIAENTSIDNLRKNPKILKTSTAKSLPSNKPVVKNIQLPINLRIANKNFISKPNKPIKNNA